MMRRIIIILLLFVLLLPFEAFSAFQNGNIINISNISVWWNSNTACSLVVDANNEKLGYAFVAGTTSAVTDVDLYLDISGDITDTNLAIQIETDSSGSPSGSVLGAATSAFAGIAADGYIGLQTLGTNTGALTIGTVYWIVIYYSSGDDLDATDKFGTKDTGFTHDYNAEKIRHHNGTNWTTTAANQFPGWFILKHSDASYSGYPRNGNSSTSGYTDIYDTNKQGLKIKFGSQVKIEGVTVYMGKSGTPGNMTVKVYEGSVEKYSSVARNGTYLAGNNQWSFQFTSSILLSADTDIYVIFEQDGASDANDFDCITNPINSTYVSAVLPDDYRFVYGSGSDPTAFNVVTDKVPDIRLVVTDPAVDFDQEAVGGAGGGASFFTMGN